MLFLVFIAFFYGVSSYAILDMNEGLYAEIAREMLSLGNFIIPHLNHVPYLEKPPMLYWLLASSYKIFGISPFAARLIPALASSVCCFSLVLFAKGINRLRIGFLSAIILASSVGFMLIGRVVFFDMLLTAFLTISLCFFYLWHQKENNFYLWFAYLTLGLAFLTKGLLPVGIATFVAMLFMALTRTPVKKFVRFFNPIGIILFLLVILPWIIAITVKSPHFAWNYFINEQLYRFLNMRIPHDYHTGPIYYYIPRVFAYLFPWSLFIPLLFKRIRGKISSQDPLKIFLWLWFLIPFIIFSLSGDKGDYYMVVGIPPLAFLIGIKLEEYILENKNRALAIVFSLVSILLITSTIYCLIYRATPAKMNAVLIYMLLHFFAYGVFGLYFIYIFRKPFLNFLLISGFIVPLIIIFVEVKVVTQNDYSQINIAQYIQKHDSDRSTYLFQNYERLSSILFFLKRPLPIIDSVSKDLYFGSKTKEAKNWFITHDQFIMRAKQHPSYVILLKDKLDVFKKTVYPIRFNIAAQSGRAYLLSSV